jgi:hypothetical protein
MEPIRLENVDQQEIPKLNDALQRAMMWWWAMYLLFLGILELRLVAWATQGFSAKKKRLAALHSLPKPVLVTNHKKVQFPPCNTLT